MSEWLLFLLAQVRILLSWKLTLAVPAWTLAVDFPIRFLVSLSGPLELAIQFTFFNFIVVVYKAACLGAHIFVVRSRAKLVRMPSEVDVQCRHHYLRGIFGHDVDKASILDHEALHGIARRGAVQPVQIVHLLNEYALSHNCSAKVERKRREILPIPGHHFADTKSGHRKNPVFSNAEVSGVNVADTLLISKDFFNKFANRLHCRTWFMFCWTEHIHQSDT